MSGDASGKPTSSYFSRFAKILFWERKKSFLFLLSLRLLVRHRMPLFCLFLLVVWALAV